MLTFGLGLGSLSTDKVQNSHLALWDLKAPEVDMKLVIYTNKTQHYQKKMYASIRSFRCGL